MRLALFFLAALAWGQETVPPPSDVTATLAKQAETIFDQKQEIQRLTTLLNWYQQQFFALQARQIEQQIAPKEPPKPAPAKPPAQGEPAK